MHVHPADSRAGQGVCFEEGQRLGMLEKRCDRQISEEGENLAPVAQLAAGDLPDDERVRHHLAVVQQLGERGVATAEMGDPDGGINQGQGRDRRRGGA